jgi:hypothetical protein
MPLFTGILLDKYEREPFLTTDRHQGGGRALVSISPVGNRSHPTCYIQRVTGEKCRWGSFHTDASSYRIAIYPPLVTPPTPVSKDTGAPGERVGREVWVGKGPTTGEREERRRSEKKGRDAHSRASWVPGSLL